MHINGNGTEWIDEDLPIPTYMEHTNKGYVVAWAIDGLFNTYNGSIYYNDIIARALLTFRDQKPSRITEDPIIDRINGQYHEKIYTLDQLQNLRSIRKKTHTRKNIDKYQDHVFWAIKMECEDQIKEFGQATFELMYDFAYRNFKDIRSMKGVESTLKSKCRNVYNWYSKRNWEIPRKYQKKDKEIVYMNRSERAKANAELREQRAKNKVINTITGLMAETYKKQNGSWHIGRIAKDLNMHRDTVSKHIKAWEEKK